MTKKKIVMYILALMCLVFFISGLWHINHLKKNMTEKTLTVGIEVSRVIKDDYEVQEDGTVLIYCRYLIYNHGESTRSISIGGLFRTEKACDFLKEDVLFADGVYTFEPHSSAEISVVFVGHHGSHELMPDRNPPEPIIIDCDDVEDVIDEE